MRLGRLLKVDGTAEDADKSELGSEVRLNDGTGEDSGESEAVCDLLDERTSRSESRRSDVDTAVPPENNCDSRIEDTAEELRCDHCAAILLRLPHLGNLDVENGDQIRRAI